jgi:hypothetical protein
VVAIGQLFVDVAGEVSPMPKVTARLVSEEKRIGVIVRPPIEALQGRFSWQPTANSRAYRSDPLVPGTWEVTVMHEDWVVTTVVKISAVVAVDLERARAARAFRRSLPERRGPACAYRDAWIADGSPLLAAGSTGRLVEHP